MSETFVIEHSEYGKNLYDLRIKSSSLPGSSLFPGITFDYALEEIRHRIKTMDEWK